ncbi:MAG: hypothetical protein ABI378_12515 [Chitinophagaceae bacterium]
MGNVQAVVSDKVTEVPVNVNAGIPSLAQRRAALMAAYDYYPFGMIMPGRSVEDGSVNCIPVSRTRFVNQVIYLNDLIAHPNSEEAAVLQIGSKDITVTAKDANQGEIISSYSFQPILNAYLNLAALSTSESGVQLDLSAEPSDAGTTNFSLLKLDNPNDNTPNATGQILAQASTVDPSPVTLMADNLQEGDVVRLLIEFNADKVTDEPQRLRIPQIIRSVITLAPQTYVTMSCDTDGAFRRDYRWGYGGHEMDNEVKGKGNSVDMGARGLDSRLGRTGSLDSKRGLYPDISPYAYALNTPIQAKDPDGNVVIFFNGMHSGDGGTAAYWGGYDQRIMDRLGDHSARYVDGALGGTQNLLEVVYNSMGLLNTVISLLESSAVSAKVRIDAGRAQGWKDAASIRAHLTKGESIKIVTHSMGTGFARGYAEGLMAYARIFDVEGKMKIDYELDVSGFQGGSLAALKENVVGRTQYKLGGHDGGKNLRELIKLNSMPTVGAIPQAENATMKEDADKGHAIAPMSSGNIPHVGNAGTSTQKPIEEGSNNGN